MNDDRGFIAALIGDGRPFLSFTGICLALCGVFALFLSATGHFLPHDVQNLGMAPEELCAINECRIVHFMFHDRVSFGGEIFAIGVIYLWLAEFPLRRREVWAWWLFTVSGVLGFGSFLAYLGYGYLDTWHGLATLALMPCFILGLAVNFFHLPSPVKLQALFRPAYPFQWARWNGKKYWIGLPARAEDSDAAAGDSKTSNPGMGSRGGLFSAFGIGRGCLLGAALGMVGAGATIMTVGMTSVFVPQDLAYMGLSAEYLEQINPRLIPLIAHDRAGFGGGVCTCGVLIFFCVWCGRPSRNLWQALALAGAAGFVTAVGVHPVIGYTDFTHLAPAILGALVYGTGLALTHGSMATVSVVVECNKDSLVG